MSKQAYVVNIPVAGHISVEVVAEDEEQAIDLAMQDETDILDAIEEIDTYRNLVQGNVFYGSLARAEVVDSFEVYNE